MRDLTWSFFLLVCMAVGLGSLWIGVVMLNDHNRGGVKYVSCGAALVALCLAAQFQT